MTSKDDKLKDKAYNVISIAAVGLISFYLASFAKTEDVKLLNYKVKELKENKASKSDLKLVLSGLCIINKDTCNLKQEIK